MKKLFTVIAVLILSAGLSHAQGINDSLVFYYPCDGNLIDMSSNGLDAFTNGSLTEDENGLPNSAYDLNGTDQFIDIPGSTLYQVDFPATFRMRFKVDSFPSLNTFLFANDFKENSYFGFFITLTKHHQVSINYGDGGQIGPESRRSKLINDTLSAGVWYELVAIWHQEDDLHIYLDCDFKVGEYDGLANQLVYGGLPFINAVVGVGDGELFYPPAYFNGQVDEISFWNRALDTKEIIALCDGEISGNLPEEQFTKNPKKLVQKVYPNPFNIQTTFELDRENKAAKELWLFNAQGKPVNQFLIKSSTFNINRNNLAAGLYYYRIVDENNAPLDTGKLIIR